MKSSIVCNKSEFVKKIRKPVGKHVRDTGKRIIEFKTCSRAESLRLELDLIKLSSLLIGSSSARLVPE